MTRRAAAFGRAIAGTAAIEFAMLAIPFLGLGLAVFEFGRACWTLEAMQESAVQGARCIGVQQSGCYSSGSYSSSGTISYVRAVASGWAVTLPSGDITPTQSTTCGNVAGFAQIQISHHFSTVVSRLIPSLGSYTLSVSSCFPNNP
jgi:Flp pilus assembly protein TadG